MGDVFAYSNIAGTSDNQTQGEAAFLFRGVPGASRIDYSVKIFSYGQNVGSTSGFLHPDYPVQEIKIVAAGSPLFLQGKLIAHFPSNMTMALLQFEGSLIWPERWNAGFTPAILVGAVYGGPTSIDTVEIPS